MCNTFVLSPLVCGIKCLHGDGCAGQCTLTLHSELAIKTAMQRVKLFASLTCRSRGDTSMILNRVSSFNIIYMGIFHDTHGNLILYPDPNLVSYLL